MASRAPAGFAGCSPSARARPVPASRRSTPRSKPFAPIRRSPPSPEMKKLLAALLLALSPAAHSQGPAPVQVILETSLGNVTLELDAAKAPKSVDNFVQYVK